jgi:hypothetical protein
MPALITSCLLGGALTERDFDGQEADARHGRSGQTGLSDLLILTDVRQHWIRNTRARVAFASLPCPFTLSGKDRMSC